MSKEMRSPYTGLVVKAMDCGSKPNLMKALQETAEKICDEFCKWPEVYRMIYKDPDDATEAMYEERCKECPMIDLLP